jgi:hypothetical protein
MTLPDLTRQALQLEPSQRARLARELLRSLDELSDAEWEALWFYEADRRHQELVSGVAESIPQDEVFAQARARRKP